MFRSLSAAHFVSRRLQVEALEHRLLLTATLIDSADINVSQLLGNQDESAFAINPANPLQMFVSSNQGPGLFAAHSNDGGATWLSSAGSGDIAPGDFILADANDTLPTACCDPTVSWDQFGNLFLGYLEGTAPRESVLALSTDGGATFNLQATLGTDTDQPTVTTGPGLGGANGSVWATYDDGPIVARGAAVTGLGAIGAFGAVQTTGVGQFGDIVIGPNGQVVVTGQSDTAIQVATDPDGLGPMPFNAALTATTTNVERFDSITPQPARSVDAEAGLAYDRSGGAFDGRLYLVYTDENPDESNDTDILLRISNDDGASWGAPVQVNDDATTTSQFFSKIAVDQTTGNVGIAWQDARNDPVGNTLVEIFATVSDDGGATFSPNLQVADGQTNGTVPATGGQQLGDYIGLAFDSGMLIPSWADNSNSTADNPNGTLQQIDIYVAQVTVDQTVNIDLGILPAGLTTATGETLSPNEVFFYEFELFEPIIGSQGDFLVIDTVGSTLVGTDRNNDTELGLYDAAGQLIATNDDFLPFPDGDSRLAFGADPMGSGSGDLAASHYFLAVAGFDTTFGATGFNATSTSNASGSIVVNFEQQVEPRNIDLGALPYGLNTPPGETLIPRKVFFYRFELTHSIDAADGDYLAIDTFGSTLTDTGTGGNDTEIGLYDAAGDLVVPPNDDFPPGRESRLAFGADPLGAASSDLAAGEYFLAVSAYDTEFNPAFDATSSSTAVGTAIVNFDMFVSTFAADFDRDNDVDGDDFLIWQSGFGTMTGATRADGDADGNGAVNGDDFLIWQQQFGSPSAPTNIDLGFLPAGSLTPADLPLASAEVVFYRFELFESIIGSQGDSLVIDTLGSTLSDTSTGGNDTEIGLYDFVGNRIAYNDDFNAPNRESRIVFGADPMGFGDIPRGVYYLAVGAFNSQFNDTGFDVTSTSAATGTVRVNFEQNVAPSTVDLGVVPSGSSTASGETLVPSEVFFYRFELFQPIVAADGDYLVIDTVGSILSDTGTGGNDTEIGLYDAAGDLIVPPNDDFPPGRESRLAYGADPLGAGSGDLVAGEYFLAVGGYDTVFNATGFDANSTSLAVGSIVVNFEQLATKRAHPAAGGAVVDAATAPAVNLQPARMAGDLRSAFTSRETVFEARQHQRQPLRDASRFAPSLVQATSQLAKFRLTEWVDRLAHARGRRSAIHELPGNELDAALESLSESDNLLPARGMFA